MDYIKQIPKIGDTRYSDWFHKPALDILRVEYYNHFSKDLSINTKDDNNEMFDPNISEYANKYILRGYISSTIMLPGVTIPNSNNFLNWKIEKDMLEKEDFSKYLNFMKNFMLQTIGNNFNFIYSYASLKDYYLAYIPYDKNKSSIFELSNFLDDLMDNSIVNVLLVSEELLSDSKNSKLVLNKIKNDQDYIKELDGTDCIIHNANVLQKKLTLFN